MLSEYFVYILTKLKTVQNVNLNLLWHIIKGVIESEYHHMNTFETFYFQNIRTAMQIIHPNNIRNQVSYVSFRILILPFPLLLIIP